VPQEQVVQGGRGARHRLGATPYEQLEALPAGVPAVGLDEGVVDALGLEPGEQEVPQPVGAMLWTAWSQNWV
jgi:hypothetical protein